MGADLAGTVTLPDSSPANDHVNPNCQLTTLATIVFDCFIYFRCIFFLGVTHFGKTFTWNAVNSNHHRNVVTHHWCKRLLSL